MRFCLLLILTAEIALWEAGSGGPKISGTYCGSLYLLKPKLCEKDWWTRAQHGTFRIWLFTPSEWRLWNSCLFLLYISKFESFPVVPVLAYFETLHLHSAKTVHKTAFSKESVGNQVRIKRGVFLAPTLVQFQIHFTSNVNSFTFFHGHRLEVLSSLGYAALISVLISGIERKNICNGFHLFLFCFSVLIWGHVFPSDFTQSCNIQKWNPLIFKDNCAHHSSERTKTRQTFSTKHYVSLIPLKGLLLWQKSHLGCIKREIFKEIMCYSFLDLSLRDLISTLQTPYRLQEKGLYQTSKDHHKELLFLWSQSLVQVSSEETFWSVVLFEAQFGRKLDKMISCWVEAGSTAVLSVVDMFSSLPRWNYAWPSCNGFSIVYTQIDISTGAPSPCGNIWGFAQRRRKFKSRCVCFDGWKIYLAFCESCWAFCDIRQGKLQQMQRTKCEWMILSSFCGNSACSLETRNSFRPPMKERIHRRVL